MEISLVNDKKLILLDNIQYIYKEKWITKVYYQKYEIEYNTYRCEREFDGCLDISEIVMQLKKEI